MVMPMMYLDSIMSAAKPANRKLNKPYLLTRVDIVRNIVTILYEAKTSSKVVAEVCNSNNEVVETIADYYREIPGNYKITYRLLDNFSDGEYKVRLLLNNAVVCQCHFVVSLNKIVSEGLYY